jgi:hypothetical protein
MRHKQRGLVGVLLLVTIAVIAVAIFSKNIWGEDSKTYQQKVNRESLKQAKAALLEYIEVGSQSQLAGALGTNSGGNAVILGRLPCPNQDGNGVSENPACGIGTAYKLAGQHSLGLFPWSTLNLPVLRDASHQCLWYAVDGAFKINPTSSPINTDSFASFSVIQPVKPTDASLLNSVWPTQLLAGNLSNSAPNNSLDRVVAVIMASGSAGGAQTQTSVGGAAYTCGLTRTVSGIPNAEASAPDFLKYYSTTINNQSLLPSSGGAPTANSVNPTAVATLKTFITADIGQEQLNDQVIWITAEEFSRAATKRVAGVLANYVNAYVAATGKYPTAALTPGGTCVTSPKNLYQGFIPGDCSGTQIIPVSPNRLDPSNDVDLWLGQAHYAVSHSCVAGGSATHPCASGTSRIKIDAGTASAILLMRGRALSGQATCTYTGSLNFYSASNTIANCLEGTNKSVVTTAIAASTTSASYVTDMSTIQYSATHSSSSNDYMIQFTLQ